MHTRFQFFGCRRSPITDVLRIAVLLLAALPGCRTTEHREMVSAHGANGSTCEDCHLGAFQAALFDHASVDYGRDCATCHAEDTWHPLRVPNHDAFRPLRGAHGIAGCGACHAAGRADPQPQTCIGCHAADKASAVPDHAAYADTCEDCHTETAFKPATFDHTDAFPLTGRHLETACASCHPNERYEGTPTLCVGCHADDRDHARPSHTGLPEACETCHTTAAWAPPTFDHEAAFPLTGKHTVAACSSCHVNQVFEGTPSRCVDCHRNVRPATHEALGYGEGCEECHNTENWAANTDHSLFPLLGKHAETACAECHPNQTYLGTPHACEACHLEDRPATPDHTGFPTDCSQCHGPAAWRPAAPADHDTFYPLTGRHVGQPCEGCHSNGRYAGTPRDCNGCHAADAARATPPHAGFDTTCTDCHTTAGWTGAHFVHDFFPIEGAHTRLDCAQCHVGGRYAGTPTTCAGCHAADATAASPSHVGFPDTCTTCHTQNAWSPATYRHRFPVPHRGVSACGDCHLDQTDFGNFSCIDCHEHRRAETDREHQGEVDGYAYDSAACYRCHANGRGDD